MRGLRSRSSSNEDTAAHVGAAGTLANIAAASAGELSPYDLQSLQMAAVELGSRAGGVKSSATAESGTPANYQPVETAWNIPGPNALVDTYTPDKNTSGTLAVDGAHVIAASDIPGDNDWFAVTLTAGQIYQFGQYAYAGVEVAATERAGVPLADAYLEIYDSAGNLLQIADGGGPNTPSGLDALMTFEATYSGTYYVNATSYDNDGDGVGDFVGDYEIFAKTATGTVYTTPYDITSPLHSIDWGGVMVNREHVSVRNPDGQEGPRPTGQPAADPAEVEGNFLGFPGKNVIYLYFAGQGDTYANVNSTIPAQVTAQDPYQYEIQAMLTAAAEFSKVADVIFVSNYTFNPTTGLYERDETIEYKPGPLGPQPNMKYATGVDGDGFDADFFYWSYPGTPGPGISLLGSMNPPDYGDEGVAQFNSADERWNAQMLQKGGFSFVTLIHEFGHGMGLAHPHDTGGGSSVMQGVQTNGVPGDDGGAGAYDLNQGIHTMMSYNDGWEKSPYGQAKTNNEGYGWLGSLMALDIAVIQDKYGVNEEWATGNDTYVLKDENVWGVYIDSATGQPAQHGPDDAATTRDGYYVGESTYYSSIWDAGGVDQITYSGARNTNIDLRPATLKYEFGGGGWMSYAFGIHGGFTIANGVTIENASTGSGNDTLRGNSANNVLNAGEGADTLWLVDGGDDTAIGGGGNDGFLFLGALTGTDAVDGGDGRDELTLQGDYSAGVTLGAITGVEVMVLLPGSDTRFGASGTENYSYSITTTDQNVASGVLMNIDGNRLRAGENLVFDGSAETDGAFYVFAGKGVDTLTGGAKNDAFLFRGPGNLTGADTVNGGAGFDELALRGDYTGANKVVFGATTISGIEAIVVVSGHDLRYGKFAGDYSFDLTMNEANVASGQAMIVDAGTLRSGERLVFDGSAETDGGRFTMFGGKGNDALTGGSGADSIRGGLGADVMKGNGGADTFVYRDTAESASGSSDQILDFLSGTDKIDLSRIDANTLVGGDQAFSWIGSNAFAGSGAAGQLRAYQDGANWFVEGDTNGDGAADLVIQLTGGPIVQTDFMP